MTELKRRSERSKHRLPYRPFFYTLDQVADILQVDLDSLKATRVYYEGRTAGPPPKTLLVARNVNPSGVKPEWRIAESELLVWMRQNRILPYSQ
jgi:hypothetical protein